MAPFPSIGLACNDSIPNPTKLELIVRAIGCDARANMHNRMAPMLISKTSETTRVHCDLVVEVRRYIKKCPPFFFISSLATRIEVSFHRNQHSTLLFLFCLIVITTQHSDF